MPNRNLTNTTRLKGRELLRRLRTRFPVLFPVDRSALKPWAMGEGYRLRQALAEAEDGEQVSNQVWRVAINLWFHGNLERRAAYFKCLTEGAPRYDLHGNVSGEVSTEEAAHAAAQLPECERQLAELRSARRPPGQGGKGASRTAGTPCLTPQETPGYGPFRRAPGNGLSRHGANTRCSLSAVTTRLSRKCVYGRSIPRTPTSGKARQHAGPATRVAVLSRGGRSRIS